MSIEKKLSEYSDKELSEMYHSYVLRHFEGQDIAYRRYDKNRLYQQPRADKGKEKRQHKAFWSSER